MTSYNNAAPLSTISPISLIFGLDVQMVGCGRTIIDETPPNLKTTNVKLISRSDCAYKMSQIFEYPYNIPHGFVCSSNDPYAILESVSIDM
jgi:hypothetical protein